MWFYLAPTQLGGSSTYVTTHGISMEPRFHTGDLAIVRSQSTYRIGEIVAYQNHELHTIVLHRIIGREGDRYIFKGDNNNFVDPEHPLASQLIGALWLHIPGAGARLQSIRSPALMGALLFFGMLLLTGGAFARTRGRRRRDRRAGEGAAHTPTQFPKHPANPVVGVLAVGLAALLPFVALALLAFTRPPSERRPYKIPYKQSGVLSYSADAPPGPVYADDRAVTGDPLFTHVLSAVDMRFAYTFHTAAAHSLAGKASLYATIASTSGWQHTFTLGAPTNFRGDHAVATGTLDLTSLLALLQNVENTTKARGTYTLAITPRVSANGASELVPVHAAFSPEVKFALDETELQPVASGSSSSAAASSSAPQFAASSSGSVTGTRNEPLSLSLGFARPSVATARTIALSAIAIILGAVLAMLALIRPILASIRPRRRDESEAIRSRYGHLIIPVAHVSQLPGIAVIDVADMDALARIAEHYDRSILYEVTQEGHAFWVADESGQFRFMLHAPEPISEHELPAAAWSAEQHSPVPNWEESPTAELAAVPAWTADVEGTATQWAQNGRAPTSAESVPQDPAVAPTWPESAAETPAVAPTWPESAAETPAVAPTWPESAAEEPAPAPAWEESYEVYAPAWAGEGDGFDASASNVPASEVYADELELGGVFRASGTQPPAPESVTPEEPAPEVWQPEEEPATVVLEPSTEHAPSERGGVSRTRAGAVFVHVTGF
jgi:signal peptidase I